MIIKYWARKRDLNDAACGTLSSYTWICMVLNFLQMHYPPILPILKINEKELLEVEYENNDSSDMHWKLCIEEPYNPERNLGNRIYNYRFKKIIEEFRRAVKYLYKANLELCCQMHEIYDKHDDEYEYCDNGIPIITLEALCKAKFI
ncbi:4080_t:CDS:2 [Gigaspora margarita]|uniref:4080_t:CDS:1 n=1 Tax=Gigaspora margarita TaxID=4874 RepID=A0ABN7V327_GIGMA|nr:4080_t:CDS:2 [Gigaspora margarita]